MSTNVMVERLNNFVDWFIPPDVVADVDMRKQARIFLYSHIFGPFIGNTVPLALYLFDPKPGAQIVLLAVAISGFMAGLSNFVGPHSATAMPVPNGR